MGVRFLYLLKNSLLERLNLIVCLRADMLTNLRVVSPVEFNRLEEPGLVLGSPKIRVRFTW